jgi:hypothetical protein
MKVKFTGLINSTYKYIFLKKKKKYYKIPNMKVEIPFFNKYIFLDKERKFYTYYVNNILIT